jgi:hypothetical protein
MQSLKHFAPGDPVSLPSHIHIFHSVAEQFCYNCYVAGVIVVDRMKEELHHPSCEELADGGNLSK